MDFTDAFRFVNLGVGVFMILGGVGKFLGEFGFQAIILGVYSIVFGIATGLLEFQVPPQVTKFASFMFSFLGRGLFYLFIGSILLGPGWYEKACGAFIGLAGVGYVVLEFIPSIEPPANMRDADSSWGAEQI